MISSPIDFQLLLLHNVSLGKDSNSNYGDGITSLIVYNVLHIVNQKYSVKFTTE